MLTRFIKVQLVIFTILTIIALLVLGIYYLRLPSVAGIGQYELRADLPRSGGLYATANVTYRGTQIGKVTDVVPTERGARATMSIDSDINIPADAVANVHSVSAIGEQYLDLVSTSDSKGPYLAPGTTITTSTVPAEVGPALDRANDGLAALPREKIDSLLTETSQAVGGLGPALQRLVDSTTAIATDLKDNLGPVNDIIQNSTPILDSQIQSGDAIQRWAANLNTISSQTAEQDQALRGALQQAAPTADQLNAVFGDVREALPQTLANLAIVADLLKRYHKGIEQALVILPQGATAVQAATIVPGQAGIDLGLSLGQPAPCLTGFLPAAQWRAPADTSPQPLPDGLYCKIPKDTPANVVRGARNYPCADVPGKRAATPAECRGNAPYEPLGTNPWYGDPNQILTCPAPAARCDQPVKPGYVIPAPSINNGTNPLPADQVPPSRPTSDPLTAPGQGNVRCSGQQPNPCIYTPAAGPSAIYSPSSGRSSDPTGSSTPSPIQAIQETADGRRCWRQPAERDRWAGAKRLGDVTDGQERSDSGDVTDGQERSDSGDVTDGQERSDSGNVTEADVTRRAERFGRGWLVGICAALLLSSGGVAVGGYLAMRAHQQSAVIAAQDAAALARAKECVSATQAPDVAALTASQSKIIECSTGDFGVQANFFTGMLVEAYQAANVAVQVSDLRGAVERHNDDGSVDVLVAVRVKVTNSAAADQQQGYRLRVNMAPADGTYKIAKLDQVTS